MVCIIQVGKTGYLDDVAGVGRVDELAAPYINTRVAYVAPVLRREKDNIPDLQAG
jgi:hypothetical protein